MICNTFFLEMAHVRLIGLHRLFGRQLCANASVHFDFKDGQAESAPGGTQLIIELKPGPAINLEYESSRLSLREKS